MTNNSTSPVPAASEAPPGNGLDEGPQAMPGAPLPPLDCIASVSDRILNCYVSSEWDNQFLTRLGMVLRRDNDGNLLPEPKRVHGETKGISVVGPSGEGKTTLVKKAVARALGDHLDDKGRGKHVVYCRVRSDATIKGVYMDLCRLTGFSSFPARMTNIEAKHLTVHRLQLAGIRVIILDEVHNQLGKNDRSVNLFLKSFLQDGRGFCLIVIGTSRLRQFILRPENDELPRRLPEFPLVPFKPDASISLINGALRDLTREAGLKFGRSIRPRPICRTSDF